MALIPNFDIYSFTDERPIDWREIFMKQHVGKYKQINFYNLCV